MEVKAKKKGQEKKKTPKVSNSKLLIVVLCWLIENQEQNEKKTTILRTKCPIGAIMGASSPWPSRMGLVRSVPPMITLNLVECAMFCLGVKFHQNFNLENTILTYTTHISWENGPNLPDVEEYFFQISRFL
jgi:hypothetical protein